MEKQGKRTREIRFYSQKNQAMCSVHSAGARDYTKWLEEREGVRGYEANIVWDTAFLSRIDRVDIRGSYLTTDWTSDFKLFFADGSYRHLGDDLETKVARARLCGKAGAVSSVLESTGYRGLEIGNGGMIMFIKVQVGI